MLVPIIENSYDFLSVINTNLHAILHRLREIAFEMSKSLYLATPLAFKPPNEGFSWDDLREIFRGCEGMASVPNGEEKLPKILTG